VGDFEFAGVVRSWSEKQDSSNFPAFTVTISDPRFILENLTIITGQYADEVKNVPNLINAYGFLESISDEVCQLDDELECRDCNDTFINGAQFGSPAEGFGGANQNDEGVPWIRLREAITLLLSGTSNPDYSPRGYAVFRGHTPVGIPAPANGMGRLPYDDFNAQIVSDFGGNGYINNYIVDITEIPFAPTYYRIESTDQTLLSLISQVCSDAGCDFYIELILTASLEKVIKVRTVKRRTQPDLGQIGQFLSGQSDYLISRNYGNELRNEPTSVFLYGDNVQSLYEVVPTGSGGILLDHNETSPVLQHWGFNSENDFNLANIFSGDRYFQTGLVEWDVNIDISPLQQNLSQPIRNGFDIPRQFATISETEIRLAMGGFHGWYNYTLFVGVTGESQNPYDVAGTYGTDFGNVLKQTNNFGTGLPLMDPLYNRSAGGNIATNDLGDYASIPVHSSPIFSSKNNPLKKDIEAIHAFIKKIGDENYNKKWVVKLPEICYYKDAQKTIDNGGRPVYNFSDVPHDGGYPASGISGVLGLPLKGTGIEKFEDPETSKIAGISRYYVPSTGSFASGNLIAGDPNALIDRTGLYTSLSADPRVYLYPTGFGEFVPAAIVTIDGPVSSGAGLSQYDSLGRNIEQPGNDIPDNIRVDGDSFGSMVQRKIAQAPNSYYPSGFAIPMFSNTNRYGPWGFVGPEGPVKFEEDKDLAPWNYGGYDLLNSGAIEKVQDGLTFQQVGERGGFTLVGYPLKSLGQDLRSARTSYSSFVLQDGTSNYGDYKYIDTTPMDGSFGPNITSINISIGEGGATTTYELATFTPSFGRMSKLNANRLKQIKALRAEQKKQSRDLKRFKAIKDRGIGYGLSDIRDQVLGVLGPENENQPKNLLAGSSAITSRPDTTDEDSTTVAATDGNIQSKKATWVSGQTTASMSQDGMFRPVSKSGEGGLPGYPSSTTVVAGNEAHSQDPMGPINEWTMPIVARDYLDPLASVSTPKHCADTNIYHDINECSFGDSVDQQNGYGPLVINGWGYDLQGKPIPNSADNAADARSGIYTSSNLTDKFLPNWLKKSRTWPTAPVDLKFDRQRGVWTVPNSFRIVQVTADTAIAPGNSGTATISNPSTIYDSGGSPVSTQTISLNVPSWMPSGLPISGGAYAFYDTSDSKWYAVFDTVGSGSGGGGGNTTQIAANTYCGGQGNTVTDTQLDLITFEDGFYVEADTGTNAYLVRNDLRFEGNRFYDITLGTGLHYESYGNCNYRIHASGTQIAANTYCGGSGNTVTDTRLELITFDHGFNVTADVGTDSYLVQNDLRFNGNLFSNLIARSGLTVTPTGNCQYIIDAEGTAPKIQSNGNCDTATISESDFSKITFGSGLDVKDNGSNNFTIDKKLTFVDASGTTLSNGVSKVTAGCGISVAGSACDITISLDKDASPGAANDVQVVKDICCSGSGLNIVYKTLRFTSCGLFSGVVDEGSC
jgi:hypothetical protein